MSRPQASAPKRLPSNRRPGSRPALVSSLTSSSPLLSRRASITGQATGLAGQPKAQRTSKTSQKLVVLPSAPQTKPLRGDDDDDPTHGYETDAGVREYKSEAERMSKDQRKKAGFKRITAYCVAETFKMKLLASFLKREHNVHPRVFDEALYVMYHLPLLPGYGPNSSIRSSAPTKAAGRKSHLSRLSEAEENGYQGSYFTTPTPSSPTDRLDGYVSSSSPVNMRFQGDTGPLPDTVPPTPSEPIEISTDVYDSSTEPLPLESEAERETDGEWANPRRPSRKTHTKPAPDEDVAEVVFFEYGVVVFFGLDESHERSVLEDIEEAGILKRRIEEDHWEVEECHFAHDPYISYPRIYNDFFTLKSHSHLLKISIAHALAQSTLLAHYETNAAVVLTSPLTLSIPKQLAKSGALQLKRNEALKLTGRLFKLRRDVNLVSNVLDVPELFWSEASLKELYDAVREYMEIEGRVQVLNEKLGVAGDFLDAIHDHLNNNAMERITWIIIWLIVVAICVALGEVVARLVVHATLPDRRIAKEIAKLSKEDARVILERMMVQISS